jgi:hypothetical protein
LLSRQEVNWITSSRFVDGCINRVMSIASDLRMTPFCPRSHGVQNKRQGQLRRRQLKRKAHETRHKLVFVDPDEEASTGPFLLAVGIGT